MDRRTGVGGGRIDILADRDLRGGGAAVLFVGDDQLIHACLPDRRSQRVGRIDRPSGNGGPLVCVGRADRRARWVESGSQLNAGEQPGRSELYHRQFLVKSDRHLVGGAAAVGRIEYGEGVVPGLIDRHDQSAADKVSILVFPHIDQRLSGRRTTAVERAGWIAAGQQQVAAGLGRRRREVFQHQRFVGSCAAVDGIGHL